MAFTPLRIPSPVSNDSFSNANFTPSIHSPKHLPVSPLSFLKKSLRPLLITTSSPNEKRRSQEFSLPPGALDDNSPQLISPFRELRRKALKGLGKMNTNSGWQKKSAFADSSLNGSATLSQATTRKKGFSNAQAPSQFAPSKRNSRFSITKPGHSRSNTPPKVLSPFLRAIELSTPQRSLENSPSHAKKEYGKSKFRRENTQEKLNISKEEKKEKKKSVKLLGTFIRRKSCCCSDCGGMNPFEKKHLNIALPPQRILQQIQERERKRQAARRNSKVLYYFSRGLNPSSSSPSTSKKASPKHGNISNRSNNKTPSHDSKLDSPASDVFQRAKKSKHSTTVRLEHPIKEQEEPRIKSRETPKKELKLDLEKTDHIGYDYVKYSAVTPILKPMSTMKDNENTTDQQGENRKSFSYGHIPKNKSLACLQENVENVENQTLQGLSVINSKKELKEQEDGQGESQDQIKALKCKTEPAHKLKEVIRKMESKKTVLENDQKITVFPDPEKYKVPNLNRSKTRAKMNKIRVQNTYLNTWNQASVDTSNGSTKNGVNSLTSPLKSGRTKVPGHQVNKEARSYKLPMLSPRERSSELKKIKITESLYDPYNLNSLSMRSPKKLNANPSRKLLLNASPEKERSVENRSLTNLSPIKMKFGKVIRNPLLSVRGPRPEGFGVFEVKEAKQEEPEVSVEKKRPRKLVKLRKQSFDKEDWTKLFEKSYTSRSSKILLSKRT